MYNFLKWWWKTASGWLAALPRCLQIRQESATCSFQFVTAVPTLSPKHPKRTNWWQLLWNSLNQKLSAWQSRFIWPRRIPWIGQHVCGTPVLSLETCLLRTHSLVLEVEADTEWHLCVTWGASGSQTARFLPFCWQNWSTKIPDPQPVFVKEFSFECSVGQQKLNELFLAPPTTYKQHQKLHQSSTKLRAWRIKVKKDEGWWRDKISEEILWWAQSAAISARWNVSLQWMKKWGNSAVMSYSVLKLWTVGEQSAGLNCIKHRIKLYEFLYESIFDERIWTCGVQICFHFFTKVWTGQDFEVGTVRWWVCLWHMRLSCWIHALNALCFNVFCNPWHFCCGAAGSEVHSWVSRGLPSWCPW